MFELNSALQMYIAVFLKFCKGQSCPIVGISSTLLNPKSESYFLSARDYFSDGECPCSFLFYNLSTYSLFYMYMYIQKAFRADLIHHLKGHNRSVKVC